MSLTFSSLSSQLAIIFDIIYFCFDIIVLDGIILNYYYLPNI